MSGIWREFRSIAIVGVLTAGVALAFPLSALDFKAAKVASSREASAAFIDLTVEEELAALKAAKTAWQAETSALERMRVRLPLGELPEDEIGAPLELASESGAFRAELRPVAYPWPAAVTSQAAPAPVRFRAEPEAVREPTFSRADLLDLTERK